MRIVMIQRLIFIIPALMVLCTPAVFTDGVNLTPDNQLVIGRAMSFAPYSFFDENGLAAGYYVDLTRAIMHVMQLDAELRIEPWEELREGMAVLRETSELKEIHGRWLGTLEPPGTPESTVLKYIAITVGPLFLILLLIALWFLTLRKQIDSRTKALLESDKMFEIVFNNSPIGIALTNSITGQFLEINHSFAEITGRSKEELTAINWMSMTHPDDVQEDQDNMVLMNTEEINGFNMEKRYIHPDGSDIWVNMTVAKVNTDGKSPPYHLTMIEDITRRKQMEEERKKLQEHINQVQKIEAVGLLAGGVAHDFNNMLGVILGHTRMIMDQVDHSGPPLSGLQEIHKAAEHSANLTQQLLAFARRQAITPKILNLNNTINGMLKMLRLLVGEDVNLTWMPAADIWHVKMDSSQIDQILTNLCINARDAIKGIGMITIKTENITIDEAHCNEHPGYMPGEYLLLTVSDNGCGMNKEALGRLFEPFYTTKESGSGLGLSTVYGIVKQNRGFITVNSEPGDGTTFKIHIPRHKDNEVQLQEIEPAESMPRGDETILLVEDEPALLKLTAMMLEIQGYTVLSASTPKQAIRLAGEYGNHIHMLLTDVVMPEINGRDLADTVLSRNSKMKCLFTSGYPADVIAHRGVVDESVNFIQKPFVIQDLAVKVREILDGE